MVFDRVFEPGPRGTFGFFVRMFVSSRPLPRPRRFLFTLRGRTRDVNLNHRLTAAPPENLEAPRRECTGGSLRGNGDPVQKLIAPAAPSAETVAFVLSLQLPRSP